MKVLILTVNAGGGHASAANAIREALEVNSSCKVLIIDTLKLINPILDKLTVGTYLKAIKTIPFLYGLAYESTEKDPPKINKSIYEKFYFLFNKLYKQILDFNPDLIIGTHPSPIDMVCELKKRNKLDIPIITVITDFTIHPFWINSTVDYIIVHHENLIFEAMSRGADKKKILPLGIPISPLFNQEIDCVNTKYDLGFDEGKPILLVMGGSLGLGNIEDVVEIVSNSISDSYQLAIITGTNKMLKDYLDEKMATNNKNIKVYGYIDFIYKLMSISSIIITKPGGLTCAEALSKKLPMLLISPIPGQEQRNAFYLINNGAAAFSRSIQYFEIVFKQILSNEQRIQHMKLACSFLAKPNSSIEIANFLKSIV